MFPHFVNPAENNTQFELLGIPSYSLVVNSNTHIKFMVKAQYLMHFNDKVLNVEPVKSSESQINYISQMERMK